MEDKAELMPMSPEGHTVAAAYLTHGTATLAARALSMETKDVTQHLRDPQVKAYIDQAYLDSGYRNRVALGKVMDSIIDKKMEELEEAEIGSSKDILDILTVAHKMRMEEMKAMVDYEKLHKAPEIQNQTNVQINEGMGEGNYGRLMKQLLGDKDVIEGK
jgi:phage terminase small subunit